MELKRVAITGLGALTPIGNNVNSLWDNGLSGVCGAAPIAKFDTRDFKTKFACELKEYEPLDYFNRKDIKRLDPYSQYALVVADEAVTDSGLKLNEVDVYRAGVIWATCNGGWTTLQDEVIKYATKNKPRFSPFFIPKVLPNMSAGLISIWHGFKGISFTVASACASSNNAITEAVNNIRLSKADIIITGGSDSSINESHIGGYNSLNALSTRNESPETASRPFDVDRDGFVMGEGAGALVLEELEHAKRREARIYAELAGVGSASDAHHITNSHPEGSGLFEAMRVALEDAGIAVKDIDYINAHATSTTVGDKSELIAIERLFGDSIEHINISGTKSMTGHTLGAAGVVEAILCIKSIEKNIIPPTINTKIIGPGFNPNLNLTIGAKQEKEVNFAMNNTSGFGGHNSTIIFKKLLS